MKKNILSPASRVGKKSRGIKVIIIPIYITYCSGFCGTQSLIMLNYDGHILFLSWHYNNYFFFFCFFFSFYNPVTYLEAIMHKTVIVFKMDIVIYTGMCM